MTPPPQNETGFTPKTEYFESNKVGKIFSSADQLGRKSIILHFLDKSVLYPDFLWFDFFNRFRRKYLCLHFIVKQKCNVSEERKLRNYFLKLQLHASHRIVFRVDVRFVPAHSNKGHKKVRHWKTADCTHGPLVKHYNDLLVAS